MVSALEVHKSKPDRVCEAKVCKSSRKALDWFPSCARPPSNRFARASAWRCVALKTSSKRSPSLAMESASLALCSAHFASTFWPTMSVCCPLASTFWQQTSTLLASSATWCSKAAHRRDSRAWSSCRRCFSATVATSSSLAVTRISKARTSLLWLAASFAVASFGFSPLSAMRSLMRCSIACIAVWNWLTMPSADLSNNSPVERLSCKMVSSAKSFCLSKSRISSSFWFCSSGSNTGIMPYMLLPSASCAMSAPFLM
mmetsp:Transcript_73636/g.213114  ORF Transcript_73636/g.213114 Transcript_73636/m.213114 type:complete len:257 (-) Transcript_73636:46-816(-)